MLLQRLAGDVLLLMDLQIPGRVSQILMSGPSLYSHREAASVYLVDPGKPTYTPSSVVFSDSDVRRGYLLGEAQS